MAHLIYRTIYIGERNDLVSWNLASIMHQTIIGTRQVTRATHVRNRICPRVELILKIIIILLIIFLGFIKSRPDLLRVSLVNRKQ